MRKKIYCMLPPVPKEFTPRYQRVMDVAAWVVIGMLFIGIWFAIRAKNPFICVFDMFLIDLNAKTMRKRWDSIDAYYRTREKLKAEVEKMIREGLDNFEIRRQQRNATLERNDNESV